MKKSLLLFCAVLLYTAPVFASGQVVVKPELKSVKIFLNGAEMTHSVSVKIDKGISEIVFQGIADNIDQNSIQVNSKGDAVILSVLQRSNYLKPGEMSDEGKALREKLDSLDYKMKTMFNEKSVLSAKQDLLLANEKVNGEKGGASIQDIQKMMDYFAKALPEIKKQILDIDVKTKKLQDEIDKIQKQIDAGQRINKPINEIVVTASADKPVTLSMTLTYLIRNAGWHPAYNVRVKDTNSPVDLSLKANIWQNSGMDWNNVKIILSTRNPSQGGTKPELYPWYIDFWQPQPAPPRPAARMNAMDKGVVAAEAMVVSASMADYFQVAETQLAVEYTPDILFSLKSGGKQNTIELQKYTVPAVYEYYAAPKLDRDAFLTAKISNWGDLKLLPGQADIYFDNSYVGKSFINPGSVKDTLTLSLGRDQNIVVERKLLKDYSDNKFLSSNVERTFGYEISVKNNKSMKINLLLQDQLPISQNEDIEVKSIEQSGAEYDPKEATLSWHLQIDPSKTETRKFVYSVTYPKDKDIPGL